MSNLPKHNILPKPTEDDEEEDDPVIKMIRKTGCLELHYEIQECIVDSKDWRKCQDQVLSFRKCMMAHTKQNPKQ